MRLTLWRAGLASVALYFSSAAPARAQAFTAFVRMGGDFGGDQVIQFQYEDGSTPDIDAGRGILLAGGGVLRLFAAAGQSVDLLASVGIKYTTIPPATNQDASWLRIPLEGMLRYGTPFGLRVGGGVALHVANVLKASGEAANARVEFETKPGFLVHVEYGRDRWAVDLRYTALEYEVSSGGSGTVNANSIGGGFTFLFGRGR